MTTLDPRILGALSHPETGKHTVFGHCPWRFQISEGRVHKKVSEISFLKALRIWEPLSARSENKILTKCLPLLMVQIYYSGPGDIYVYIYFFNLGAKKRVCLYIKTMTFALLRGCHLIRIPERSLIWAGLLSKSTLQNIFISLCIYQ